MRELRLPTLTSLRGWAMVPSPVSIPGVDGAPNGAGRPTMAMITDASLASETEVEGLAFARGTAHRG